MKFYEVHDEDGCLAKMRNFDSAKRTALAFLTMKSGRRMHIKIHPNDPQIPVASIRLDPETGTWSKPEGPRRMRPAVASGQDELRAASPG
jgi:hypothetical protein